MARVERPEAGFRTSVILAEPSGKPSAVPVEAASGEGRALAVVTRIDNAPASERADIFTPGGAVSLSGIGAGR